MKSKGKYAVKSRGDVLGSVDLTFLTLVLILLVFGLVMMFSASYASAYYERGNSFHYILRQGAFAALGLVVMAFVANIDYRKYRKFCWPIYWIVLGLLLFVLTQTPINSARRWIYLPLGQTFQPSEVAKFAIIAVFADLIDRNKNHMHTFRFGLLPFLIAAGPILLLVVIEPHISATVVLCIMCAVILFVGGLNMKWIGAGVGLVTVGISALALIPYLRERFMVRFDMWQDPFLDPLNTGFQTIQSLYAIGSGGLLGAGIGNSRQKYLFLPEPQNDFVYAIVCEELGFIGAIVVILLFSALICRGFAIALNCKDTFGSMLVIGMTAQVGVQALLNIAVVTNTVPNTGIGLPFFSYGGTALVIMLAQMGVILSVSRHSLIQKE